MLPQLFLSLSILFSSVAARGILTSYYPAYKANATVNWKHTDLVYYFVDVTTKHGFTLGAGQTVAGLKSFIAEAKAHNTKTAVAIGGWTGSEYFSSLVNATNREHFADKIVDYVNQYGFGGVDIDWEYPNFQGAGNNELNPSDSANLLALLQLLRKKLGWKAWISADVSPQGLYGPDGKTTLKDYRAFSKIVSAFNVLSYDFVGSFSVGNTGPNSPFRNCLSGLSIFTAIDKYTSAGFASNKIVLGIPAYSNEWTLKSSKLNTNVTKGNPGEKKEYRTQIYQEFSKYVPGQLTYEQLKKKGSIKGKAGDSGGNGYQRFYDVCSQTPFLFDQKTKSFVVYEDAQSASVKAGEARLRGYKGVSIFDSTGFDSYVYGRISAALT